MRVIGWVVVLAAAVSAGPTLPASAGELKCAGYCRGSSKLSYAVGTTYVYKYTAETVTSVSGAGDDESGLRLSADVEIYSVSPCDFTLQLHNVNLSDSSPEELLRLSEFSSALEKNALLFSFHDGRVDELCAISTDPPWVLNIKRGVLSAFQNSMQDLESDLKLFETDVTGDCETEYNVRSLGHELSVVDKRKNLQACTHRMDHFLSLQSTPYTSDSPARSLPLVKSDHHCVQTFEKGLLTQTVCKETHLFRPFSNGDNGAVTRVVQNLEYVHHATDRPPAKTVGDTSRTTLLFQHEVTASEGEARAHTIANILQELQGMTGNGVESDVPSVFSRLVTTLRSTGYPTLAKVFSRTKQQNTRKFLLDAMPLVGTADGLTVMVDLYKSGEISDAELDSWLTSLTFLKRPTLTMLLAVSSLLDGEPRPKAVLGLSALAHSYCQTDSDCSKREPIQNYLLRLERLLGDGCHVKGRADMELKILALKGIGNMGVLPTSFNTIAKCYSNAENPLEVRLAAVGAHRRLPCTGTWTHDLLQVYANMNQDTEVRISAYLAVMQCPSADALARVRDTLYKEEVNQVASFVWTHLTNIQETSSRWKQSIKDLISSDFLQNKFQTDARKFSRNYEGSAFFDSLNAGVTLDSNIVFTPQSYLPRSASLNLTLDVFGESVNVFEIGSRAEGFELVVEDMFGPGGYFPDKSLKKVLQSARGKHDNEELENSISQLGEIFNKNSKLNIEPQASMYARVFGNEIHYSRFQGLEELMSGHSAKNDPFAAFSKLLGGQDVDYTKSFVFLDASYRFPTAVGLSLELSVNGSATVGLKAGGNVDFSVGPTRVRAKIAPSAAVHVVGTMAVDGVLTKAGLRSVSSLHTNTFLEAHATLQGRSLVDIKLDVPREKVEILEVASRMFVLRRGGDREVEGISENKQASSGCSSDAVSIITGMKLCTELVYPNASRNDFAPHFPLTGPAKLRIDLIKTDTFDSYELNFQKLSQAEGDLRTVIFKFDTPNSRVSRRIVTYFSVDQKNAVIKANMETPFVKLDASGKLDYGDKLKALDLSLYMNNKNLFSTKAVVKTSLNGLLKRYEPTLTVVVHNVLDVRLNGKVNYIEDTKYSADFEVKGLTSTPLLLSADLNCADDKYDMVGSLKSPVVEGTIHANLRQTHAYVNTKVTVEYSVRQAKAESVNLFLKAQSGYKRDTQKNSVYGSLQMSALPQYNLLLRWDRMTGENYAEYNGRFGLGKTEWHTKQMYRFHARGRDNVDFALLSHLACPSKNVDYKAAIEYKITEFSLSTHVLAQLNPQQRFYSALSYQRLDERQEMTVEFSTPWRIASIRGEMVEREPGHFATRVEGRYEVMGAREVSSIRTLALHSTYIDASTDTRQDLKLSVDLSGQWTASFSGELVSDLDTSNGWARLDLLDNKYRTNVTYAMNSEGQHTFDSAVLLVDTLYRSQVILLNTDKKREFSIDLNLSKHLFLSTKTLNEGPIQGVEFELLWDKDVDPTRRISLVAHANNVKREALIEFPGQYIKAELITLPRRISGLLEWTEDQKIAMNLEWNVDQDGANGEAKLTTPFPGLRSQGLTVDYKRNNTIAQIRTEVTWQDERITLSATGAEEKLLDDSYFSTKHKVQAEVTSTLTHLHNLTVLYQHMYSPKADSKIAAVLSGDAVVFAGRQTVTASELIASLYLQRLCKLVPSLEGIVTSLNSASQGRNRTVQLSVGLDKSLVVQLVTQNAGASGSIRVISPYAELRNTSARFNYNNTGAELSLVVDVEHEKKSTSLSIMGSRTATLVVGSGTLTTPFTETLEAGFTHSSEKGSLIEGVSLSFGGKQVLLGSLVGSYLSWRDFKLSTDLTLPPHSLVTKLENRLGASGLKTELEAFWNGDRVSSSLVVRPYEITLTALASRLQPAREVTFEFSHKQKPGVCVTRLKLHDYLTVLHQLTLKGGTDWESVVSLKTRAGEGHITNKETWSPGTLDYSHALIVEWNGPIATANVAVSLHEDGLVKAAEGALTTAWSHPVAFVFNLPITRTTFNPELKLRYQNDKEISFVLFVQCEPQASKFELEVKSPIHKPFNINGFYDVSLPTKAVLLTVKWEENQVDFKSTLHLESKKGVGVILLNRSDVVGDYLNANFKYDVTQEEDMTGHVTAAYKDKKVGITLSGSLSDQVCMGSCEITTPFSSWEKLTSSFGLDLSKLEKVLTVVVGRNHEIASLSSTLRPSNPLTFNAELTSSVSNLSLSAVLEAEPRRSLQLLFGNGGRLTKLGLSLHTDPEVGLLEASVESPAEGFENVLCRASYVGKPGNSSVGVLIERNQSTLLRIDASSLWKDNTTGQASLTFVSPFEGLEKLTGLLKHKLKTEPDQEILTDIVLTRNEERVEIASSIATSLDALHVHVQCKTPLDEYKVLVADLAVKSTQMQKSMELSLAKNREYIQASVVLNSRDTWNAAGTFHATTPFQGYEDLSAGFDYNWGKSLVDDNSASMVDGKAKLFLNAFEGVNEIEIDLNYLPSLYKTNISAALPILSITKINLEGKVDIKQQVLSLKGKVNDQFVSVQGELHENSLEALILTSIKDIEELNLSTTFTLTPEKKAGSFSLAKNEQEFVVAMSLVANPVTSELHVAGKTPINQWEEFSADAILDTSEEKKHATASFERPNDRYSIRAEWSGQEGANGSYSVLLSSTNPGFRTVALAAEYDLTQSLSGKALLRTDGFEVEGLVSLTDKDLIAVLKTPLQQLRHLALSANYNLDSRANSVMLQLRKNEDEFKFGIKSLMTPDETLILISTPFEGCRESKVQLTHRGVFGNGSQVLGVSAFNESSKLLDVSAEVDLRLESRAGFNVNASLPVFSPVSWRTEAWFVTTPSQRNVVFRLCNDDANLAELEGSFSLDREHGVKCEARVTASLLGYEKHALTLELDSNQDSLKSVFRLANYFTEDEYSVRLLLRDTTFLLRLSSPVEGYEDFSLYLSNKEGQLSVDFNTSFFYYDTLKLAGKVSTRTEHGNFLTFSMGKNEEKYDMDWKLQYDNLHGKSSFAFASPFKYYKRLVVESSYDLRTDAKVVMLGFGRNKHSAQIDCSLAMKSWLSLETSMNLTTSYTEVPKIRLYGKLDADQPSKKNLIFFAHVNDTQQIGINFYQENGPNRAKMALVSVTPHHETSFIAKGGYDFSDPSTLVSVEGMLGVLDALFNISAVGKEGLKRGELHGRFSRDKTSHQGRLGWDVENEPKNKGVKVTVEVGDERKAELSATLEGDETDVKMLLSLTDFLSHSYAITADRSVTDEKIVGRFIVHWNRKMAVLESSLERTSSEYSVQVKFTSPFENLEEILFQTSWENVSSRRLAAFLKWKEDKRVSLNVLYSESRMQIEFGSPYTSPVLFIFSLSASDLRTQVLTSFYYGTWMNDLNVTFNSGNDSNFVLTLVTPIYDIQFLRLDASLKSAVAKSEGLLSLATKEDSWQISGRVEGNGYKGDVRVKLTTPVHEGEAVALYDVSHGYAGQLLISHNEEMLVNGSAKLLPSLLAFEARTPWEGLKSIRVDGRVEAQKHQSRLVATAILEDELELTASVSVETDQKVTAEVNVKTPWSEDFSLHGAYSSADDHVVQATLRVGDRVTEMLGSGRYKADGMRMELEAECAVEGGGSFSVKAGYDWQGPQKKAHASVNAGEAALNVRAQGQVSGNGINGDLRVDTPIDGFKLLEVQVRLEKTGAIVLNVNDRRHQLQYTTLFSSDSIGGQVSILSPYYQLKNAELNIKYGRNVFNLNGEINGKSVEFLNSFHFESSKYSFISKLNTPLRSMSQIELKYDFDVKKSVFSSLMQWSPTGKVIIESKLDAKNFRVHLTTPFDNIRSVDLSSQIVGSGSQYSVLTTVDWDGLKVDFDGDVKHEPLDVNLNLQAEWRGSQTASLRTTLSNKKDKVSMSVVGAVLEKKVNIVGEVDKVNLAAKVHIETPFSENLPVYAEARLTNDPWKTCDVDIRVSLPAVSYKLTASYALTDSNLKVGLDMDLPFIKSSLAMGGSYSNNNFTDMETIFFINENRISIGYKITKNVFTGSIDINIPDMSVSLQRVDVQTSLSFSPNVQASVTYRSSNYYGSLTASLAKNEDGFSVRGEADLPHILGALIHTARVIVKYQGPERFLDLRLDDGRSTRAGTLEVLTSKTDLSITGRISWPSLGEREVAVAMANNWQLVTVSVFDALRVEFKNDVASGSVAVSYRGKDHKLSYRSSRDLKGFEAGLELESALLIAGNVGLGISSEVTAENVRAAVKCSMGSLRNEAFVHLVNEQKKKHLAIKIIKASQTVARFNVTKEMKGRVVESEASFEWSNALHSMTFRYGPAWPLDIKFTASSPRLPGGFVKSQFSLDHTSIMAQASIGKQALNRYLSLEGAYDVGKKTANFEFQAPFCGVKTVSLGGSFEVSRQKVDISVNGRYSSEAVSDIELSSKLVVSQAGIDSQIHLQTPFAQVKDFTAVVQIPFEFRDRNDLKLLLSLPAGTRYEAHARAHKLPDAFELSAGVTYEARRFGGVVKLSRNPALSLDLELDTPYKSFSHYQIRLRGQRSLVEGEDIVNYVEWGERRIELRHSTVFSRSKLDYRVQLTTPFGGYERFVAGLKLQYDVNKKAIVVLSTPGMKRDWTIEFDFSLNSATDSRFLLDVQAPIFAGFKSASLLVGSQYDPDTASYRGVISANYNQHDFITKLDSVVEENGLKVDFYTQLDEDKISTQFIGGLQESGVIVGVFEIETPFSRLRSGKISLKTLDYNLQPLQFNVNVNSMDIVDVKIFESEDKKKTIEVRNPWRSVSAAYSLYFGEDVRVWGEVCWNVDKKTTSQFGAGIHVASGRRNRDVVLNMKLPNRDMYLNHTRHDSSFGLDYSTMFSWKTNSVIGYRVLLNLESIFKPSALLRLDLPFRAFEVTSHADFNLRNYGNQFFWDAAGDRSKKMGISLSRSPNSVELSLQHAAMKHDLSLRVEQENCLSPDPRYPSTLKVALQYSPVQQDLFTAGVLYKRAVPGSQGTEAFVSVRHDASNLDHNARWATLHTSELNSARLAVYYKKSLTGEKQRLEAYAALRKNKPGYELMVRDTNNKLALMGSVGKKGFSTQLSMNQKEPLIVEGQIGEQETSATLDVGYGAGRGYTLSAGMPTPRLITAGITRRLHGLPSTDGQATVRLNSSRLLWTQVRWRPSALDNMKVSLFKEYADVSLVAQSIVNSFSQVFEEDLADQLTAVFSAVHANSFADIGAYTNKELRLLTFDFADTMKAAASMYEQNDFYIKDIHQSLVGVISYIQQKASGVMKQFVLLIEAFCSTVAQFFSLVYKTFSVEFTQVFKFFSDVQELVNTGYDYVRDALLDLRQVSKNLRNGARSLLTALREEVARAEQTAKRATAAVEDFVIVVVQACSDSLRALTITVQHYIIILHHSILAIEHSIIEMSQTVVDTLSSIKELDELASLYIECVEWLEEFRVYHYLDSIFQYLNTVSEMLIQDFSRMFSEYKSSIDAALDLVSSRVEQIDRTPAVVYVKHTIATVYEKVSWLWTYLEMSTHLEVYVRSVLNNLDEVVAQLLHSVDMGPQPRHQHAQRQLVVRPGFLELSQQLPVDWESFQEWPEFSQLADPSSTHAEGIDSYQDYWLELLNKLTPNYSKASLLPPFGATGIVAGKQHYITFDNYFYDFVGDCSYLLASDFLDNKYSIVVNYEFMNNNVVKKSLTVISSEQEIKISPNYQVSVNGKKTELPAIVGDGIVLSRFGNVLMVEIESYVSVECNLVHGICTVHVTGWNFGKTGGLLGTFDNEPSNDVSLPNRTSTSDLARFASSWRVGNVSRCQTTVNHAITPPANDAAADTCDAYLTDLESPLADCYSSVDPMPYYHMCISDVARSDNTASVCAAAVAYATVCRKSGIQLQLPQECVQCQLTNSPALSPGETTVLNAGVPKSADVVFVVEQESCVRGVNLAKMATKLDAALVQQGLTDNRFSLVGFGGDVFQEPHSRTANGEIWTTGRGLEKAFAGLALSEGEDSRNEQSVYDALTFASRLAFRGGVSKTVVLVQCSACSSQLDYGSMMGLLLQKDITLHLLEPGAIGSHKNANKLFGADLSGVYTARNGKHTKPNADLLKQVTLPRDHCSPLAFETNGTVFNLERMFGSNKLSVSSKKFADVWSRRVAQGAQPSPCQKCECVASDDGLGQVQCTTCVTASVDQYLLDWQSLVSEDFDQSGVPTSAIIDEEDT